MKTLKGMMQVVKENFTIQWKKNQLKKVLQNLREDFIAIIGDYKEGEKVSINPYGLTGAGIHFINSTIKVQLRLEKPADRFYAVKALLENQQK
jgi:hypothetical protein